MKTLTVKHVGKYFLVFTILVAMLITFNACSGGSQDTSSNNNNQNSNLSFADWQIKYNMCLESKGMKGQSTNDQESTFDISYNDMQAMDDCNAEVGKAPARTSEQSPAELEDVISKALKVNECLRKYGYEVDDTAAAMGAIGLPDGALPEHGEKCRQEAGLEAK